MEQRIVGYTLLVLTLVSLVWLISCLVKRDHQCGQSGGVMLEGSCYEAASLRVLPLR